MIDKYLIECNCYRLIHQRIKNKNAKTNTKEISNAKTGIDAKTKINVSNIIPGMNKVLNNNIIKNTVNFAAAA